MANFISTLWAGNYGGGSESSGFGQPFFRVLIEATLNANGKIELA